MSYILTPDPMSPAIGSIKETPHIPNKLAVSGLVSCTNGDT